MKPASLIFLLVLSIVTNSCRNIKTAKKYVDNEFVSKINNYFYSEDKQLFVSSLLTQDSMSDLNNFLNFYTKIDQDSFNIDSFQYNVKDSSYYYLINAITLFDKDTLESKQYILKSQKVNSVNFFGRLWYCKYLKKDAECLKCYNDIINNYNDIAMGHYDFVDYLILTNRFKEAQKYLKTIIPKFEKPYLFYNQKSFVEVKQGDIQIAIESANKALSIRYNIESLKLLGAIYLYEIQHYDKALDVLKKGLVLSNSDSELLNMLAECFWFKNDNDSAAYFYLETLNNTKDQKSFLNVFADYLDFILLEKGKEELFEIIKNSKFGFSFEEVSIVYYIIVDLKFNNNIHNANQLFKIYEENYPDNVKWAKDRIYNWYQSDW